MRLQAVIGGYAGEATCVIGNYDVKTGVLVVANKMKYREARIEPDLALITNLTFEESDFIFKEEDFRNAIRHFFSMKGQKLIVLHTTIDGSLDPSNQIERQGIDENGPKYAIMPDMSNGAMCVLAMVAYVSKQQSIISAIETAEEMSDWFSV